MLLLRKYIPYAIVQINRVMKPKDKIKISRIYFCSESSSSKSEENADRKKSQENRNKDVPALASSFESVSDKTKEAYLNMVTIFEGRNVHRRNHVEFIYAALKNMEEFGVHRDIDVYKALINVMPKGKFIPTNIFQAEFMHYPKQQQCIIDLLEQMEDNGVIPDYEMEAMLLNVFGRRGHPLRKYWRMMYWMPKFKNLSPWPLPNPVPNETLELAKLAIARMCTVDLQSRVVVYETKEIEDSLDDTWVVSGISLEQSNLLKNHDKSKAIYIEGPFQIWLRNKNVNYFILRADPNIDELKQFEIEDDHDPDDIRKLQVPLFGSTNIRDTTKIAKRRSVHQQDDGTIFAICATGTSSKDSLLSWIRLLQIHGNPILSDIPILFKLISSKSDSGIIPVNNQIHIESDR